MAAIDEFLGIPYRLNGRDRSGMDCLGLVVMYLRSIGKQIPDNDGRPIETDWRRDAKARVMSWLGRHAQPVATPTGGDIAVFQLLDGTVHLGAMIDGHTVLHILEDRPSMLTPLHRLSRHLLGVYRLI